MLNAFDAVDFSGIGDLIGIGDLGIGVSVKVKLPPEVKQAVRELPNLSEGVKSVGAALDAANVTSQTVAVMYTFGAIVAVLLLREIYKK